MKIVLNDESFRYDVHSLMRAFYQYKELNYDIISLDISGYTPQISLLEDEIRIIIPRDLAGDRTNTKNVFKKNLYQLLREKTQKDLPWGTLTGIRPIKILAKMLQDGYSDTEIKEYMKDTYLISDEKLSLSLDIAKRERTLLETIDMKNTYSLYVGIPFCPSICAYCSFSSYPIGLYNDRVEKYLEALYKELECVAKCLKEKDLVTIYIGGGTPSTLSHGQLSSLIEHIQSNFKLDKLRELSVECGRPDSITKEKLMALKKCGVDRISINPQTMNDNTLNLIGRAHSTKDIEKAFDLARSVGIPVINCDLIAGLPGEDTEDIKYTLNKIEGLNPNNITVHSLAIKRAAKLNFSEEWSEFKSNVSNETMSLFMSKISEMGLSPYYLYRQKQISGNLENIGFAKPGLECLYNCLIMGEYHPIIACGCGGVSKIVSGDDGKPQRVSNVKDVDTYINRIDEMIERKLQWL